MADTNPPRSGCYLVDGPRAGETVKILDARGELPNTITTSARDGASKGAARYERADWGDPAFARYRLVVELNVSPDE